MFSNFLKLLAIAVLCFSSVKTEEEKMCPFMAACLKETDGKVKAEDVKVLMTAKEKDLEGIRDDVLCVSKCTLEKKQILVGEKIDLEKLSQDKMVTEKIKKKEDFLECAKKVGAIKKCSDMKEFMKCKIRFSEQ